MKVTCPSCKQSFTQNEALPDLSWVRPDKRFGCPHCKKYFSKSPFEAFLATGAPITFGLWGVMWTFTDLGGNFEYKQILGVVFLSLAFLTIFVERYALKNSLDKFKDGRS